VKKERHYEVMNHPEMGYIVIVWDSKQKGKVIAKNSFSSYRDATTWGRAVKSGKIKLEVEQC